MLNFDKLITPVYTRHVWLYDRGDYQTFSCDLDNTDCSSLKNDDLDTYTKNIYEREKYHLFGSQMLKCQHFKSYERKNSILGLSEPNKSHHGVSRAKFSLTEPIPLQAVYIDHSRNPRLLYGSPWSRTHGR